MLGQGRGKKKERKGEWDLSTSHSFAHTSGTAFQVVWVCSEADKLRWHSLRCFFFSFFFFISSSTTHSISPLPDPFFSSIFFWCYMLWLISLSVVLWSDLLWCSFGIWKWFISLASCLFLHTIWLNKHVWAKYRPRKKIMDAFICFLSVEFQSLCKIFKIKACLRSSHGVFSLNWSCCHLLSVWLKEINGM